MILAQTLAWAAYLSNSQLALIAATCWDTAILSTGVCISTITLFTFFHYLVSTYWVIGFNEASTALLRANSIYIFLDTVFAANRKPVIVGFKTRCCFIKHNVVPFRRSRGTLFCVWIMLTKDENEHILNFTTTSKHEHHDQYSSSLALPEYYV